MGLQTVPEPEDLKREAQRAREREDGEWDIDSLRVWFGNRLPSYLWHNGWKEKAMQEGYSWPQFLQIISLNKRDIIRWLRGSKEWEGLLQEIEGTLRDSTFKEVL